MIKRVISLLLISVAMLIPLGIYAEENDNEYKNAFDTLKSFEAYPENFEIDPYSFVDRGMMSMLLCYMLGINTTAEEAVTGYKDVEQSHPYAAYIKCVSEMNAMSGYNDGTFKPDDKLIFADAVKALLTALNYRLKAEAKGGYPAGYMQIAKDTGIFSSITNYSANSNVNFGIASVMILNALEVPVLDQDSYSSGGSISLIKGQSILYSVYNIKRVRGVVNAAYLTRINLGTELDEGYIEIDSVRYKGGNTDVDTCMGLKVLTYVKNDENDSGTVLSYKVDMDEKQAVTIDAKDIGEVTAGSNISYTAYTKTYSKSKTYYLPANITVIYNNALLTPQDRGQKPLRDFLKPEYGRVRLIDNDNNGVYDLLFIEDFKIMTLLNISTTQMYDKNSDYRLNIDPNENIRMIVFKDGKKISFNEVLAGYVLSIAESINKTGFKSISIYVSGDMAEGNISEIYEEDGRTYVGINGLVYPILNQFKKGIDYDLGWEAVFRLSYEGIIASIDKNAFAGKNYAWLIGCEASQKLIGNPVRLKILDMDGEVKILELTSKVRFMDSASNEFDYTYTQEGIKRKLTDANGKTLQQLMLIEKNSEDKITSITLAIDKRDDDRFNRPVKGQTDLKGGGGGITRNRQGNYYTFKSGGIQFNVLYDAGAFGFTNPLDTTHQEEIEKTNTDESMYSVKPMSTGELTKDGGTSHPFDFYDVDEYCVVSDLVKHQKSSGATGSNTEDSNDAALSMVSKVGSAIDSANKKLTFTENLAAGDYTFVVYSEFNDAKSNEIEISVNKAFITPSGILNEYIEKFKIQSYNRDSSLFDVTSEVFDDVILKADDTYRGYNIKVEWTSDDDEVLSNTGLVIPQSTAATVNLEANFKLTDPTDVESTVDLSKTFTLKAVVDGSKMRPEKAFNLDLVEFNAIILPSSAASNITFKTSAMYGSVISWNTSDTAISNTGVVTRKEVSKTVTVEAAMTNDMPDDTHSIVRSFTVVVPESVSGGSTGTSSTGTSGSTGSFKSGGTHDAAYTPVPSASLEPTDAPDKNTAPFTDIESVSWAKAAINYLYENEIISGISDTEFGANRNITRAQITKIVVNALKFESDNESVSLLDVSENDWFYDYLRVACGLDIIQGYDEGIFAPDVELLRQDLCVVLYRSLKVSEFEFAGESKEYVFLDDENISEYAKEAVYVLYNEGFVSGVGDDKFEPLRTSTRAEAAQLIYKVIQ